MFETITCNCIVCEDVNPVFRNYTLITEQDGEITLRTMDVTNDQSASITLDRVNARILANLLMGFVIGP